MRVVQKPGPPDRRARFLEVETHDNKVAVAHFVGELLQLSRVVFHRIHIVDRARAYNDKFSRVRSFENIANGAARLPYEQTRLLGQRNLVHDLPRGRQDAVLKNVGVAHVFFVVGGGF